MLRTLLIVSSLGLFLLIPAANSQIPTNGLVAYYPFNGNASDESGNGNVGPVDRATLTTASLTSFVFFEAPS